MKMYYIHGYLSEPNSTKGMLLKEKLGVVPVKYRDCKPEELVISDCIKRIKDEIKDEKEVVLIGSSLGGFLAARTALDTPNVKHLILFNPAIIPPDYNLEKITDLPAQIAKDMQDKNLFEKKITAEIVILVGKNDDVVPSSWVISFAKAQDATIKLLDDDHRLSKNMHKLPEIIKDILDKKH